MLTHSSHKNRKMGHPNQGRRTETCKFGCFGRFFLRSEHLLGCTVQQSSGKHTRFGPYFTPNPLIHTGLGSPTSSCALSHNLLYVKYDKFRRWSANRSQHALLQAVRPFAFLSLMLCGKTEIRFLPGQTDCKCPHGVLVSGFPSGARIARGRGEPNPSGCIQISLVRFLFSLFCLSLG